MTKVQLLFSGGHVHTLETHNETLVSDLVIAKGNGESVISIYGEDGDEVIAMVNLELLEMAWGVSSE